MSREELFEKNKGLVIYAFKKYFKSVNKFDDDIFQTGCLGLWKACLHFDDNKNIKFSTFAVPCIRNEICMYLRSENKHKNLVSFDALNKIAVEDVDIDMSILNAIGVNEKDYAFLLAQGLTNSECERCLSISRQALSIKRKKIKKNLEEVLKRSWYDARRVRESH